MARLDVDGSDLLLRLTWREKIGGFRANLRAPLSSVRSVSVPRYPWQALRGWRMAGIAIPRIVALGTRKHGTGFDFSVLHRNMPAVQIELATGRFERWMVSVNEGEDAKVVAKRVADAAGIQVSASR